MALAGHPHMLSSAHRQEDRLQDGLVGEAHAQQAAAVAALARPEMMETSDDGNVRRWKRRGISASPSQELINIYLRRWRDLASASRMARVRSVASPSRRAAEAVMDAIASLPDTSKKSAWTHRTIIEARWVPAAL
jgi:hypothetical protein